MNTAFLELTARLRRPGVLQLEGSLNGPVETSFMEFAVLVDGNAKKAVLLFRIRLYPYDLGILKAATDALDVCLVGIPDEKTAGTPRDDDFYDRCMRHLRVLCCPRTDVRPLDWLYDPDDPVGSGAFVAHCRSAIEAILGPSWQTLSTQPHECALLTAEGLRSAHGEWLVGAMGIGGIAIPGIALPEAATRQEARLAEFSTGRTDLPAGTQEGHA